MTNSNIVMIALAPLLMFRIYKRVKRLTVRQKSRPWRHWCSVTLFPLSLALVLLTQSVDMPALEALGAGAATGLLLGIVSLGRTGFERIGSDYFYTPYAPIGLVVSMLFIGRAVYRIYEIIMFGHQQTANIGHSPLTMGILGIMAGYYFAYGAGLLRWRSAASAAEVKA